MTQRDLNRAVSRATGETVTEISNRGFSRLEPLPSEPAVEDLILDWDQAQAEQNVALFRRRDIPTVA